MENNILQGKLKGVLFIGISVLLGSTLPLVYNNTAMFLIATACCVTGAYGIFKILNSKI